VQQTITVKATRKSDGVEIEQAIPIKVEHPAHLPAQVAAVLQQMIGLMGMVYKDPNVPGRIRLTPACDLAEIWCDVPSIMVVDAMEGESIIKP
jgi:hypothetical protein